MDDIYIRYQARHILTESGLSPSRANELIEELSVAQLKKAVALGLISLHSALSVFGLTPDDKAEIEAAAQQQAPITQQADAGDIDNFTNALDDYESGKLQDRGDFKWGPENKRTGEKDLLPSGGPENAVFYGSDLGMSEVEFENMVQQLGATAGDSAKVFQDMLNDIEDHGIQDMANQIQNADLSPEQVEQLVQQAQSFGISADAVQKIAENPAKALSSMIDDMSSLIGAMQSATTDLHKFLDGINTAGYIDWSR